MKILLINPPKYKGVDYVREGRCMQPKSVWNNIWPPLTLNYLATLLQEKNDVRLIDFIAENKDVEGFKSEVKNYKPNVLIINNGVPSIKGDLKTAEIAKDIDSKIKTITFGIFPTIRPEETLNSFKIDYAVLNEPELTIQELVSKIEKGNPKKVKGIAYKKGKEIVKTKRREFIKDLDAELGVPDRSLLKNEAYTFPFDKKPFAFVLLGRGCPYPCTFCVSPVYYGKKYRTRDPVKVVDEMQQCYEEHGMKNFMFWGESFTLKKEYANKLCDEIIKRDLEFNWITTSRVDTLDQELLKKMKKTGCYLLGLGIETPNENILKNVKKKTSLEQIKKAIKMCKKADIKTMGHFIFGFPGETKETAENTVRFAKQCGVDYAQFYCAVPYPGTEFWQEAEKKGHILSEDWDLYEQNYAVIKTDELEAEDLMKYRTRAFQEYYFRPKKMFQHLKQLRSPKEFLNTLISGVSVLKWFRAKKR